MCFGGKPKMKPPKTETAIPAPPIVDQTPTIVDGGDNASAQRAEKRKKQTNPGLSLFQIQLLPGATATTGEEPGAGTQQM